MSAETSANSRNWSCGPLVAVSITVRPPSAAAANAERDLPNPVGAAMATKRLLLLMIRCTLSHCDARHDVNWDGMPRSFGVTGGGSVDIGRGLDMAGRLSMIIIGDQKCSTTIRLLK